MASRMGSYDIFLSSKDTFLKHDTLDYMEGDWNFEDDDDKILESIRYGDKLMGDDELHGFLSPGSEEKEGEGDPEPEELESEMDSSEMIDFEPSDLLSYAVGEEILSADSASSAGSCGSSDDHNQDFSVVELVGILPQGVKTFQIVQQSSVDDDEDDDVKVLSVPTLSKSVKILNIPSNRKLSAAQHEQPHTTFQELKLSDEERRLLAKEGITMPSHFPITKSEERELKRIRRKIRNKISAQDSRKRKKEFVDTLQQRVNEVEDENSVLNKRVRTLELVNSRLCAQVKKLQNALAQVARSGGNSTGNHNGGGNGNNPNVVPAATTLLVLILSLALVVLPTMEKAGGKTSASVENSVLGSLDESNASLSGKSRTMMDISSQNVKNGLGYDDVELELDSVPSLAKIPRFSFHQGVKEDPGRRVSFPAPKLSTTSTGNGKIGIGAPRKRNSFQMNSILVEQLD